MKRIFLIIIIVLFFTSCKNNCSNIKDNITVINHSGDGVYTEKGIKRILKEHGSWFNYLYKQDFSRRRIDNSYLLCYFISIEKIYDSFPNITSLNYYNDSVKVVFLKIKSLEDYETPGKIPLLMDEKMLEKEYLGEKDYGCRDILNILKEQRYKTPKAKYVYMLVLKNELEKIRQDISNVSLNLLQYDFNSIGNLYFENQSTDTVYSRIYYSYGQYDLSKLESSEQIFRYYDSIDNVVRRKLKLDS